MNNQKKIIKRLNQIYIDFITKMASLSMSGAIWSKYTTILSERSTSKRTFLILIDGVSKMCVSDQRQTVACIGRIWQQIQIEFKQF